MIRGLGVDIGGTKIQFCLIDDQLAARPIRKVPTALLRRGTPRFADDLARLIAATMPPACPRVGVSLNGILDKSRVVASTLMGGLPDLDLAAFLTDRLGVPVAADDDIHAMTKAEAALGGVEPPFAMLNLGTGIGVGFHDGHVLRGSFAAGLISELDIEVPELGRRSSLDRTVCGRGIREMHGIIAGEPLDAVRVFARAREGDKPALRTISIFARHLGWTLKAIAKFYHPREIVINGSIKGGADMFLPPALAEYRRGVDALFIAGVRVSHVEHAAEIGMLIDDPANLT